MLRGAATGSPRPSSAQGTGPDPDSMGAAPRIATGKPTRGDDFYEIDMSLEPSEETATAYTHTRPSTATELPDNGAANHLGHRRQSTAPNLSPLRIDSRPSSPQRGHLQKLSDMALTGDGRARKAASPGASLVGWLSGTTTPSAQEEISPETPRSRQGISPTDSTPKSATKQSRFGFLTSSVNALTARLAAQTSTIPNNINDELLNLDVETALFPGSATDGDAFSPAAYKNLQANATGLLLKMQNAYRQRTIALHELQAERSAEQEESDESQLRVESLKMQLEHMAEKAAEQEKLMQELMSELVAEKKARMEERAAVNERTSGEASLLAAEDLGVDEDQKRKKWRSSRDTVKSDISSTIDTDDESARSESVFSRSRSPTIPVAATENVAETVSPVSMSKPRSRDAGPDGCRNCNGDDASMAWNTVTVLRDENKELKERIGQLEVAVESAIALVGGLGR